MATDAPAPAPRIMSDPLQNWHPFGDKAGQRLPIPGRVFLNSCVMGVTSLPEGAIRPGETV